MELSEAQRLASRMSQKLAVKRRKEWSPLVMIADLSQEVGELAAAVMALEGHLPHKKLTRTDLEAEVADVFYSLLVIGNHYGVDLENRFVEDLQDSKQRFL